MLAKFGDDRDGFAAVLHANISPTSPIQSQEHLYGREHQIQQVEQALYAPGRSIFIYGDRGVGKTSLAQTVAYSFQYVEHDPVLITCTPDSTFCGIMEFAIAKLHQGERRKPGSTTKAKFLIPTKVPVGFEVEHIRNAERPEARDSSLDLNSTIHALLEIAEARNNQNTIVVLDEFDRLASENERGHFADFIKQLGDQQVPVRFVFCGVAESVQKLLGTHGSAYRYLEGVELQRLSWKARYEIIENAATALGVEVDDKPRFRIAAISDGFPYYIHLICEKLFWQMFNAELPCTLPTVDHFREAVSEAVMGIEQHLRASYDQATAKSTSDFEDVLWAMADHPDFQRNTESIYGSYWDLFGGLHQSADRQLADRSTVVARLNALKGESRGHVLSNVAHRRGWYQFTESIMRGYVRLRAEEHGVELAQDYSGASGANVNQAYPVRGARSSRRGATRRDWEKTKTPTGYR